MTNYLKKIRLGQPVNFQAFLKTLPEDILRRHRAVFGTEKVATNRWRVTILDEAAFATLEARAAPSADRVEAAGQGDSHRHGLAHSFLLVYREGLPTARPDTVVVSEDGSDTGFTPKPTVLVIENEANFFFYRDMLRFASQSLEEPLSLAVCDVVLGGGKRITRKACLDWLGQYQTVHCAFDYDAGGLEMFATISRHLGRKARLVQPADWTSLASRFRNTPKTTERFTRALSLAQDLGFDDLARVIRNTGKFMEQEMILDERAGGGS